MFATKPHPLRHYLLQIWILHFLINVQKGQCLRQLPLPHHNLFRMPFLRFLIKQKSINVYVNGADEMYQATVTALPQPMIYWPASISGL